MTADRIAIRAIISGRVQGVGYRHWTQQRAKGVGLEGFVRNLKTGSVEAVFAGLRADVDDMLSVCRMGPRGADVTDIKTEVWDDDVPSGFTVLATL